MLLLVRAALALDAHGAAATPSAGAAPAAPLLVPEAAAPGPTVFVVGEAARTPAMGWAVDGNGDPVPLLDDLTGLTFGGGYAYKRLGIDVAVPVWLHYSGTDGAETGAFLGDIRVGVPFALWRGADGLGASVRLEGALPTGSQAALLGGGWGGGLGAVIGRTGEGFGWSFAAGIAGDTDATLANVDRSVVLPLGLEMGWSRGWFGAGVEAWFSPSLSATEAPWSSAPGEALARVGVRTKSGLSVTLAGGHAITPGIGGSGGRALVRVGWSRPAPAAARPEPVAHVASPYDLLVDVRDEAGKPIDATVTVTGEGAPAPVQLGRDGTEPVTLAPGDWVVTVAAPGRETQVRAVRIDPDQYPQATLDAVLPAAEAGTGDLTLRVVDAHGDPVDAVAITVDGAARGETSTGGTLTLDGVHTGPRTVVLDAPGFVPTAPITLEAGADRTVVLLRPPGSVKVVARYGDAPAADAEVRLFGPAEVAPRPLGDDGEELFQLAPGHWLVVVSAPKLGVQQREVDVEAGSVALVEVDVRLEADEGDGALGVRVLDPDGRRVDGAEVRLDGVPLGKTSNGGTLGVAGLRAGPRVLEVRGPRLRPSLPRTIQVGGPQDVDVVMAWQQGTVHVRAHGASAEPVDGQVRFVGPASVPPTSLGADGEGWFQLDSGDWQVALSAPSLGLQTRAFHMEPEGIALVDIDAGLLGAAGAATLALSVTGPEGTPVEGSHVRVDDRDIGTLAGSLLRVEGLSPGRHRVAVDGTAFAAWSQDTTLRAGDNPLDVHLAWAKTTVRVHAVGPQGVVDDAVARFYGPVSLPPEPLGAEGSRLFELDRRDGWWLVGSSMRWGLAERPLGAVPDKGVPLVELAFHAPDPGKAALLIEAVDPDGVAIPGAGLKVDDVATSMPLGYRFLPDRTPGPLTLHVEAPGFVPADEKLSLVEGTQTRRVRLEWRPRPVRVHVTDLAGKPVDAQVRFVGTRMVPADPTGPDGLTEGTLRPGPWQVLVSATELGARSVEVAVPPGDEPLDVTVVLQASRVTVSATELRIAEQVHFATDEATIQPDSFPILEEVAAAVALAPGIGRIEIQGHTDTVGDPVYNLDLSQRRAEAVRAWLVTHGVDPARLVAKGYGQTVPIAPNTTEAGRRANRRVQFEIVGANGGS